MKFVGSRTDRFRVIWLPVWFDAEVQHILRGSIDLKAFCLPLVSDLFSGSCSRNGFTAPSITSFPHASQKKRKYLLQSLIKARKHFPLKPQGKVSLHFIGPKWVIYSFTRQSLYLERGGWALQIGWSLSELTPGTESRVTSSGSGTFPQRKSGMPSSWKRRKWIQAAKPQVPTTMFRVNDKYHCPHSALNRPLTHDSYYSWCQCQHILQNNERVNITIKGRKGQLVFIRWGSLYPERYDRNYPWKSMIEEGRWI